MADVKRGIALAGDALATVSVGGAEMVTTREVLDAEAGTASEQAADVIALPGFDEYLLGYKDRSLMLADEHKQAIIPGGNGVFQWTIVREGRVVATWRRTAGRARTVVNVLPLVPLRGRDRAAVERAVQRYAQFVHRPVEVRWP